jgi:general secretion pathway protein D
MIPTISMMMAVLVGPGFGDERQTAANDRAVERAAEPAFATSREAREAVARALRESSRASGRDPIETTPTVVAVYRQVGLSEKLPASERRRLQAQLRTRLAELQDVLHRRVVRAAASNSGGAAGYAQQLIDLIQSTIAPDTWAANGGNGTLYFYQPLNVLVVRQTAEVHEQIGGTLGQLRR